MPIKVKLDRLTVPQAEKAEDSQLYVLNKSNPKGNINFVVTDEGGQKVSVQIPITFIPVDLTTFATKEAALRHPHFRRLVAKGFIHIVTTQSAEEFLKDPRAKEEHERIYEVLTDDSELDFQAPVSETVNAEPPKTRSGAEISQFVQNILLRVSSESVKDLIVELEGKYDTLSEADITYLMDNTSSAELKEWCAEALSSEDEDESK